MRTVYPPAHDSSGKATVKTDEQITAVPRIAAGTDPLSLLPANPEGDRLQALKVAPPDRFAGIRQHGGDRGARQSCTPSLNNPLLLL